MSFLGFLGSYAHRHDTSFNTLIITATQQSVRQWKQFDNDNKAQSSSNEFLGIITV